MILALLALAAQATATSNISGGRISYPRELGPSIVPYMNCTNQHANADERWPASDAAILRQIFADARQACAEVRGSGFESADRILRSDSRYRDRSAREAYINSLFGQVDASFETLARALESMNQPARQATGTSNAQN